MTWTDGGIRPPHPDIIPANSDIGGQDSLNGVLMIGDKGIISTNINDSSPLMPKLYLYDGETEFGPEVEEMLEPCLLYTSPSPRDVEESRMPSSA